MCNHVFWPIRYHFVNSEDEAAKARQADLLSAMANFDCDDSNTIRFAEFANGFRKFRSSGQHLRGESHLTRIHVM